MRSSNTINSLPKHLRQLTAVLMVPLVLSLWMMNLAPTSHAEEGMEEPTLALEIIYFGVVEDPCGDTFELHGQIQAENPGGLTITFTGVVTGTAQADSNGSFNYFVFGQQGISGNVTATVTQDAATSSSNVTI